MSGRYRDKKTGWKAKDKKYRLQQSTRARKNRGKKIVRALIVLTSSPPAQ